jgi:hypothetical protein
MFTWITTFGIATGLAGVGAYVDKLVSIRHKSKLHLAMHRWWNRLDETKIPNYLHLLSFWISSRAEKLFYSNHWRMIVAYSIISWLLLTISILLEPFFLNLQGFQFVASCSLFHTGIYLRFSNRNGNTQKLERFEPTPRNLDCGVNDSVSSLVDISVCNLQFCFRYVCTRFCHKP